MALRATKENLPAGRLCFMTSEHCGIDCTWGLLV